MIEVVGIRFKRAGKVYYFSPGEIKINKGDNVIVETARGIEFGKCVISSKNISEDEVIPPLKKVIRKADDEDLEKYLDNKKREKEAFDICLKKIEKHNLVMRLIDVEYTFDNNKIIFYFTAEGRVDFRELVKDLASIFRTRIELRQIGVRDQAKLVGGIGPCGRSMCCASFLGEFAPVSIKMAKEQNLSLNPSKISGICGRLMCCLNYEQDTYEKIRKIMPKVGSIVKTEFGEGQVVVNNLVKEMIRVKLKNKDGEETVKEVSIYEVNLVSGEYEDVVNEKDIKIEVEDEIDKKAVKELFKAD